MNTVQILRQKTTLLFFLFCLADNLSAKANIYFSNPPDSTYRIQKVVIDAGHGGKDSGCLGYSKKQEKDITLKIALALGRKIKEEYPNVEVIYTRDKDIFIPLDRRAEIANKNRADLFISIHCNYLVDKGVYHGAETYVLGLHKTKENLEVARRENAAIILEDNAEKRYGSLKWDNPVNNIIVSAWQASYLDRSMKLAEEVQKQLSDVAKRKNLGVKQAGFLVLRETTMPSILIETGYMSNAEEERILNSAQGQANQAEAIFRAFKNYKKSVENNVAIETNTSVATYTISQPITEEIVVSDTPKANKLVVKNAARVQQKPMNQKPSKNNNTRIYKVQLTTAPQKINTKNEAKWEIVNEVEIRKEDGLFKYLAVGFDSYTAALEAARELNEKGFKGAFVVVYEGDKRVK